MKKLLALLLVLAMALGLAACGSNPYAEYEEINKMLADGDYEDAIEEILDLSDGEANPEKVLEVLVEYAQTNMGNSDDPENPGNDEPIVEEPVETEPPTPSDEEWTALHTYRDMVNTLHDYAENGTRMDNLYFYASGMDESLRGADAFVYIYDQLQTMEVVDAWLTSQYIQENYSDYAELPDRQTVLSRFSKVEDVKLTETGSSTDKMGNVSNKGENNWHYDPNGVLYQSYVYQYNSPYRIYVYDDSSTCTYIYADNGDLINKKFGYSDRVDALHTFTYENGRIVSESRVTNYGEMIYTYAYNEAGQLAQISWTDSYLYEINYTYDEAGHLIKEEKIAYDSWAEQYGMHVADYKYVQEYVYEGGVLVSGSYSYENWDYKYDYNWRDETYTLTEEYMYRQALDQYTYACDDQGRVVAVTVIPGDEMYTYGDNIGTVYSAETNVSEEYVITYGDYWFYTE